MSGILENALALIPDEEIERHRSMFEGGFLDKYDSFQKRREILLREKQRAITTFYRERVSLNDCLTEIKRINNEQRKNEFEEMGFIYIALGKTLGFEKAEEILRAIWREFPDTLKESERADAEKYVKGKLQQLIAMAQGQTYDQYKAKLESDTETK